MAALSAHGELRFAGQGSIRSGKGARVAWLLLVAQLALAGVLLLAATGKALRAEEFTAALRLSHLPPGFIAPLAVAVPLLEAGLAVALLLGGERSVVAALVATAGLFAAFTLWMGWVRGRRLRVRCGCFGVGGAEVGTRSIGRNLLLLLVAVAGAVLAARTENLLPGPSLPMAVTVTALGACVALLVALRAGWPSLALTIDRLEAQGQADGE